VGATFSDRLSQLGYAKARQLLVVTGLAVLAIVVVVMYARRVDSVEVVATILFVPIFLASSSAACWAGSSPRSPRSVSTPPCGDRPSTRWA
jgi:hypothetical protein